MSYRLPPTDPVRERRRRFVLCLRDVVAFRTKHIFVYLRSITRVFFEQNRFVFSFFFLMLFVQYSGDLIFLRVRFEIGTDKAVI